MNLKSKDYYFDKFLNAELYYMISSLLGLGDPGFTHERLYLSFGDEPIPDVYLIQFLLITEIVYRKNGEVSKLTGFHLGQIDLDFDQIQIYSGQCSKSELDPERDELDVSFIRSALINKSEPNVFHPFTFLNGIDRITSVPNFSERKTNDLFHFFSETPLPEKVRYNLDFGTIGSSGTDFSNDYYLIVRPSGRQSGAVAVSNFQLFDNGKEEYADDFEERVEITETFVDLVNIQRYDKGDTEQVALELSELLKLEQNEYKRKQKITIEDPEEYKQSILPAITETVHRLLGEVSPSTKQALLSGKTVEELIIICKRKFDSEFDLNFPSYGISGASEIAWNEVFSDFNDGFWDSF